MTAAPTTVPWIASASSRSLVHREPNRPAARVRPVEEGDGAVGTVCIYQAASPEAIREHANAAELPVDEIIKVADTVIVREDPVPAAS